MVLSNKNIFDTDATINKNVPSVSLNNTYLEEIKNYGMIYKVPEFAAPCRTQG